MLIKKICKICGKEFEYQHWRPGNVQYCSKQCLGIALRAEPNTVCTNCGKKFHMKNSRREKYERNLGYFCCKKCADEYKQIGYSGNKNHQFGKTGDKNALFKGDVVLEKNGKQIDRWVYCPGHPYANKSGRVKEHRLIVEKNYSLFDPKWFDVVNGIHVLKKSAVVHHKDGNHDNNGISNLEILTRGSHTRVHNINNPMPRSDKNGQFISKKAI